MSSGKVMQITTPSRNSRNKLAGHGPLKQEVMSGIIGMQFQSYTLKLHEIALSI
jgi:hypothetical protein